MGDRGMRMPPVIRKLQHCYHNYVISFVLFSPGYFVCFVVFGIFIIIVMYVVRVSSLWTHVWMCGFHHVEEL